MRGDLQQRLRRIHGRLLHQRGIVTKRRYTKAPKYRGGIPFTYGPLAHLLKNRVYLGEVHHDGKWYPAEHKPILDHKTFDQVQTLLAENRVTTQTRRSTSGALLAGKILDDNVMEAKGVLKNAEGKVQSAYGDVKEELKK